MGNLQPLIQLGLDEGDLFGIEVVEMVNELVDAAGCEWCLIRPNLRNLIFVAWHHS